DGGDSWRCLNKGVAADFMPEKDPEYGHDPHCVVQHPLRPDHLYQQNHCGFYRIDRPSERWEREGANMPRAVGDVGFPVVAHPRGGVGAVPAAVAARCPGVNCRTAAGGGRLRRHINPFVSTDMVTDLGRRLGPSVEVMIVAALSGG